VTGLLTSYADLMPTFKSFYRAHIDTNIQTLALQYLQRHNRHHNKQYVHCTPTIPND